jgi:hypothetical protein
VQSGEALKLRTGPALSQQVHIRTRLVSGCLIMTINPGQSAKGSIASPPPPPKVGAIMRKAPTTRPEGQQLSDIARAALTPRVGSAPGPKERRRLRLDDRHLHRLAALRASMRAQVPQCLQLLAPLRPSLLVRVPVCGQLGLHTASGATSQPFLSSSAASPALPKTLTLMYSVLRANRSAQALARNRWAGTLAGPAARPVAADVGRACRTHGMLRDIGTGAAGWPAPGQRTGKERRRSSSDREVTELPSCGRIPADPCGTRSSVETDQISL